MKPNGNFGRLSKGASPQSEDNLRATLKVSCCASLGLVATSSAAQAYIDPGTGSILLQTFIGLMAAGAAFLTGFGARLRKQFGWRRPAPTSEQSVNDPALAAPKHSNDRR